jgi:hypothetical protein
MVARPVAAGLLGGLALTLAACSVSWTGNSSGHASPGPVGSGPTGSQVMATLDAATSVHVAGQLSLRGSMSTLDVGLLRAGEESGMVTAGAVPPVTVIVTGGKFYLLVTRDLLTRAQPLLARLGLKPASCPGVCGKYLQVSVPEGQTLTSEVGMAQLTASVGREAASASRAGTTTVNGQRAIVLRAADGTMLDVAAHGTPYVLRVSRGSGSAAATLTFTQWNGVSVPAAPAPADVVSLSQL